MTGPHSAVGNMSDCRYVYVCRSRGREFDPSPVSCFHGDHEIISTANLLSSFHSRRVVVSYKQKYVHKLAQEKGVS